MRIWNIYWILISDRCNPKIQIDDIFISFKWRCKCFGYFWLHILRAIAACRWNNIVFKRCIIENAFNRTFSDKEWNYEMWNSENDRNLTLSDRYRPESDFITVWHYHAAIATITCYWPSCDWSAQSTRDIVESDSQLNWYKRYHWPQCVM